MAKGKGRIPRRTCIVCGRVAAKSELMRLILDDEGRVIRDEPGSGKGRGAYVCKSSSCLERGIDRRRSQRAFKGRKVVSVGPLLGSPEARDGVKTENNEKGSLGEVDG